MLLQKDSWTNYRGQEGKKPWVTNLSGGPIRTVCVFPEVLIVEGYVYDQHGDTESVYHLIKGINGAENDIREGGDEKGQAG